jgi:hypothetical protein
MATEAKEQLQVSHQRVEGRGEALPSLALSRSVVLRDEVVFGTPAGEIGAL